MTNNLTVLQRIKRKMKRILIEYRFRRRNNNKDFTLIAQNCIGGLIYSALGLPFKSPTIKMFIEDMNFIKLVENLEYYMSVPAKPLMDEYVDPIDNNIRYPKILIDDVEICCLHYKDCQDAITAWERRRKRINFKNVYVIGNSWNLHENYALVERLCNCKYKTIVFTYQQYDNERCVCLPGKNWRLDDRGSVRPAITDYKENGCGLRYYEEFFDFVDWLN